MKGKLTLSPSSVSTYLQCPRKFYYQYKEKLPTKDQPHFNLGTFVHGALEFFHKELINDDNIDKRPKILKKSCESFYEKMKKDGKQLTKSQIQEAYLMLQSYLKHLENKFPYKVISLEEKFLISLNEDYNLTGIVDRLDKDADENFHIKDYKTNKSLKYMKPLQLNMYGIWLFDNYPNESEYRASYLMLRFDGKPISYNFKKEDVNKCRDEIIALAEKISSDERWKKNMTKLCDYCDFNEICLNSW